MTLAELRTASAVCWSEVASEERDTRRTIGSTTQRSVRRYIATEGYRFQVDVYAAVSFFVPRKAVEPLDNPRGVVLREQVLADSTVVGDLLNPGRLARAVPMCSVDTGEGRPVVAVQRALGKNDLFIITIEKRSSHSPVSIGFEPTTLGW